MKLVVVVALLIGCQRGTRSAPANSDVIGPAPKLTIVTPPFEVPAPSDRVIAIGRGVQHACVVRASGAVDCWGQPRSCMKCVAPAPPDGRVRRLPEIDDAVAISPGARCFVRRTGEVECLDPETGKLTPVVGLDHVRAATDDGCFLLDNGGVSCVDPDGVHRIEQFRDGVSIASANRTTCIVRKDGALYCGAPSNVYQTVPGVEHVRAVAMIDRMVCVIENQPRCFSMHLTSNGVLIERDDHRIPTLGSEFAGATQLAIGLAGYGEHDDLRYVVDGLVAGRVVSADPKPSTIPLVEDAQLLAAGCVVRATGAVACWGDNRGAVLAQPTTIGRIDVPPTPVPGVANIASIAVGATDTWALTRDGRALHWGNRGDGVVEREPREVKFGPDAFGNERLVQIVTTPDGFVCVRGELGHVWCQFHHDRVRTVEKLDVDGVANLSIFGDTFVTIEHADGSRELAGSVREDAANHELRPDGAVQDVVSSAVRMECRRYATGQVACDETPMSQLTGATTIASGDRDACAIVKGRVMCWDVKRTPQPVDGISLATTLVMSRDRGCAIDSGRVACWHFTKDGGSTKPTQILATGAVSLALGGGNRARGQESHAMADRPHLAGEYGCAVMLDHTVQCWGANLAGELLDGSFHSTATPIGIRLD